MASAIAPAATDEARIATQGRWMAALAAIVALGAAARFYHLGANSLWMDEALSVAYARLSLGQFLKVLWAREINMALYYALLRGWIHLGDSEATVRALSAVAGVLTLPLVYRLGQRLYDRPTGLLAALLLAFNAFHIRYSQEARAYALVTLLVTASTLLLVEAVERRTQRLWTAYAVCSAAMLYTHVLAAFVIAAHAAWLLWIGVGLDQQLVARTLKTLTILSLPLAIFIGHAGATPVRWIPPTSLNTLKEMFVLLAGNSAAMAILGATLGLAAFAVRFRRSGTAESRATALILLWLLLPIAGVALVSLLRPMFLPRYLLMCTPAAALGIVVCIRALRWRPAMFAAAIAAVAFTASATRSAYSDPMGSVPQDYRQATELVLRSARPGDAIVFYPAAARAAYEAYRGDRRGPEVLYPAHAEPYLDLLPQPLVEVLPTLPLDRRRVYLMLGKIPVQSRELGEDVMRTWLTRHLRLESDTSFVNTEILIFDRNPHP